MRRALFTGAFLAIGGLLLVAPDGPSARAVSPAPRLMTFFDDRGGLALRMDVEPLSRDAGRFLFRVPGRGVYEGNAAAGTRFLAPTSVVVKFSGTAVLRPLALADGSLGSPAFTPTAVNISLQAQIDPAHHSAEATLIDGANRHHLVSRSAGVADLGRTLAAFEAALPADDWSALYDLANSDVRRAYSRQDFAAQGASQAAVMGTIVGLRRVAQSGVQTSDEGATYVTVTYEVTTQTPAGPTRVSTWDVWFIRQSDGWVVWSSVER